MISIDQAYVDAAAPNAEAAKNGRALQLKRKFTLLHIDASQTLLFGECQGSGKDPYRVSCDFARPEQPTYRCSCPSRQFPCKHCIGLMYAYVDSQASFTPAEVPAELAEKRDKLAAKAEKKQDEPAKPKTVNKAALSKKIEAQLEGLDLLEKLTLDLTRIGIGNMNAKSAREIEEKAKQLGNSFLPGAQAALHGYTKLFSDESGKYADKAPGAEAIYSEALDQLSRLHALVKQGRADLQRRADDPELKPETSSGIAAWLGHAWQLSELKAAGLVQSNAELVQLAFNSYDDVARQEYIDTGIWMNLADGQVVQTQNLRPYKAAKYIKSDDSFFQVATVPELYIYPGDVNPRVRWEGMLPRPIAAADFARIRAHARADFASVVKAVKNSIKAPLADKQPVHVLRFARIGLVQNHTVIEDGAGQRLVLSDRGMTEEPPSCHLLSLISPKLHIDQVMVVRFHHDLDTRMLRVKPLAIVTDAEVLRLTM